MQKIRWFFLVVGIVLVLALALQNNDSATVTLLWLQQPMPLSVLMLSTTAIGFLCGALLTASMLRNRKKTKETAPKLKQSNVEESSIEGRTT